MTPAPNPGDTSPRPLDRQLRVLVVDDDRDSVLTLMALLHDERHDVRVAYTGASALVVASHFNPDALFIDIKLPDISGWEVARQICGASDHGRRPLLVAMSGIYRMSADKKMAETVGFDHYVLKPYDPSAVLALLDPLLWGEA